MMRNQCVKTVAKPPEVICANCEIERNHARNVVVVVVVVVAAVVVVVVASLKSLCGRRRLVAFDRSFWRCALIRAASVT